MTTDELKAMRERVERENASSREHPEVEFVAYARTDIPKLLDEVERLTKALDDDYNSAKRFHREADRLRRLLGEAEADSDRKLAQREAETIKRLRDNAPCQCEYSKGKCLVCSYFDEAQQARESQNR